MSYKYYKRLKMWKNRTGTFKLYESDMSSTSYEWYDLGKWFVTKDGDKIYVVNSYSYSQQTNRHMSSLLEVLKEKRIKYEMFQAPRGLQNLDAAKKYYLNAIASLMVKDKYGHYSRTSYINNWINSLDKLEKFGITYTNAELDKIFKDAEKSRRSELDWKKEQRKRQREQYLQTIKGKKELFQKQLNQMVK